MKECHHVFVFGSNLAGRHGKGAALAARRRYGAVYGRGEGIQGRSYAIPTKDRELRRLPLGDIRLHVRNFKLYARRNPGYEFFVTAIGCGNAGYSAEQIAPMFCNVSRNVHLPKTFGGAGW